MGAVEKENTGTSGGDGERESAFGAGCGGVGDLAAEEMEGGEVAGGGKAVGGGKIVLGYGRREGWWRRRETAEGARRGLVWCVGVAGVLTLGWWVAMFWSCRPGVDYFCVLGFMPLALAGVWGALGWMLVKFLREYPGLGRRGMLLLAVVAFVMAPYNYVRAGAHMFSLSVRYHLWRAGGAEKVRGEFNQWVAAQAAYEKSGGRKLLLGVGGPGGTVVAWPAVRMPGGVRYMRAQFPSRFGMTLRGAIDLDNVTFFTASDIWIGPPGWKLGTGVDFWSAVTGRRRRIADGIWVEIGTYAK